MNILKAYNLNFVFVCLLMPQYLDSFWWLPFVRQVFPKRSVTFQSCNIAAMPYRTKFSRGSKMGFKILHIVWVHPLITRISHPVLGVHTEEVKRVFDHLPVAVVFSVCKKIFWWELTYIVPFSKRSLMFFLTIFFNII